MRLLPRRIRNVILGGIGIPLLFLAFLYSDNVMVGFSDFKFLSGATEVDTLTITTTGGYTTGFSVKIYNKEDISMTYRLGFVDAGVTNDSFAQPACLGQHETTQFGNYVTGNTSLFTIPAGGSGIQTLSVTFPAAYSGLYRGCIMFYPVMTGVYTSTSGSGTTTDMNTLPRRGGFINAQVTSSTSNFAITVRPAFRPGSLGNNTGSSIISADFWLFAYLNSAWTGIYNSAKNPGDPKITTSKDGTGTVSFAPPLSGTLYLVAFKGSGTLSLGFTGIRNNTITGFNFFREHSLIV